jgi:phosphodiesterase/alkaline phosphatase D-like protein
MGDRSVNKMLMTLSVTCAVGGLLCAGQVLAQQTGQPQPPAPKAASVTIISQPTLEGAHDDTAIIRWTTNNPGGANDHFGVVQYGTSPGALTKTAKSHIRLNQGHSETMFRVRIDGLQPQTTYYYTVTSMEANGTSDGITSDVNQFTTPAPGARIMNYPQPKG